MSTPHAIALPVFTFDLIRVDAYITGGPAVAAHRKVRGRAGGRPAAVGPCAGHRVAATKPSPWLHLDPREGGRAEAVSPCAGRRVAATKPSPWLHLDHPLQAASFLGFRVELGGEQGASSAGSWLVAFAFPACLGLAASSTAITGERSCISKVQKGIRGAPAPNQPVGSRLQPQSSLHRSRL